MLASMRTDEAGRWSLAVAIHLAGIAAIAFIHVQMSAGVVFAPFYLIPVITSSYGWGRAAGVLVAIAASIGWSFTAESTDLAGGPVVAGWDPLRRGALLLHLGPIRGLFPT